MNIDTGDERTNRLIPTAQQLAAAVHEHDQPRINSLLHNADLHGLVILLAAMVPDDQPPSELLGWTNNPEEYHRLRNEGVSTVAANNLLAAHQEPHP